MRTCTIFRCAFFNRSTI